MVGELSLYPNICITVFLSPFPSYMVAQSGLIRLVFIGTLSSALFARRLPSLRPFVKQLFAVSPF